MPRALLAVAIIAMGTVHGEPPVEAAMFVVDSTEFALDREPGDGRCEATGEPARCTLRAALDETNALPGPDTVTIPSGTYPAGLTPTVDGSLQVGDTVDLIGAGPDHTVIDGGGQMRVLSLNAGFARVRGITLRGAAPRGT